MSESNSNGMPEGIDPALWRGLTQPRLTRRQALAMGGGLAASMFLTSGVAGASLPNASVGTKSWWKKEKLHHTVNFANWPLYIDTLNGKYPSLEHFTKTTKTKVNYFQVIVMTNNNPPLGYLIELGWLIPLDHTMMPNFDKYAGPLVKNPAWDRGNKYTMAWQSGWTSIAYNSAKVKNPGDSVQILFDKKYAGRVGMFNDPYELGSVGLLALGIEPATSTEKDWSKAATLLQKQKSDGIVAAYYDQSYIQHLKNGDVWVSQAYSGDIYQANLDTKYKDLVLMIPKEGLMMWTDNMCIPLYAQNPKDAMALMDYYYSPVTQSVVEYYNDYICPVPSAKQQLLHPTSWNKTALASLKPEIGLPTTATADSPLVFPSGRESSLTKTYYQFKNQEEIDAWTNLFLPIIQGA
jgi:spermidine/putrescine transport system substrate-binding protein